MADPFSDGRIETTLPKPWEEEHGFGDVLYDWMERAPWLAVSLAAHLLVYFMLAAIPWNRFQAPEEVILTAGLAPEVQELFDDPIETPKDPIETPDERDEPVLIDADHPDDDPAETSDSLAPADVPSEHFSNNDMGEVALGELGLGGGGKLGGGIRGSKGKGGGGRASEKAIEDALHWLKMHQHPDGYWDADGFDQECGSIASTVCEGLGRPTHDVGLTGLALLAFLGDGHTVNRGRHRDVVVRGIQWLKSEQDPDTGLFGSDDSHDFLYDHALAALAMTETYYFSRSPTFKGPAQRAVRYIQHARNPYGAWRYDVPPVGRNDTSVTGWMVFVLTSAKEAGLEVDPAALDGALSWIEEATDPATGRVGYDNFGSLSSRTPANEHFPREKGEAMTAVGLLCRIFLGQSPDEHEVLRKHADLLRRTPPEWDPEGFGCDMYYWYYGTYAMFQMGKPYWSAWEKAMQSAVLRTQRTDGDAKGSWDPVGPWGHAGGRVYSTALMALSLEVYFRYAKVIGSR